MGRSSSNSSAKISSFYLLKLDTRNFQDITETYNMTKFEGAKMGVPQLGPQKIKLFNHLS